MKFIKKCEGLFRHSNKDYGFKNIIEFYKDGKPITVRDEYDNDITKETLAIAIFGYRTMTENLAPFIDDDTLDDIIHAGGYENWNNRRQRK